MLLKLFKWCGFGKFYVYVYVVPVHDVQRRMVHTRIYMLHSLEDIFTDLWKRLYTRNTLDISERVFRHAWYQSFDLTNLFKDMIREFMLLFSFCRYSLYRGNLPLLLPTLYTFPYLLYQICYNWTIHHRIWSV